MSVFVCMPDQGSQPGDLRCRCCGFESPDPEAFAVSACWPCAFGDNPECENCLRTGVLVSKFNISRQKAKSHILKSAIVTFCKLVIPPHKATGGVISPPCKRCERLFREWSEGLEGVQQS